MKNSKITLLLILFLFFISTFSCRPPDTEFGTLQKKKYIEIQKEPEKEIIEPSKEVVEATKQFQEMHKRSSLVVNPFTGYVKQIANFLSKPKEDVKPM